MPILHLPEAIPMKYQYWFNIDFTLEIFLMKSKKVFSHYLCNVFKYKHLNFEIIFRVLIKVWPMQIIFAQYYYTVIRLVKIINNKRI